MPSVLWLGSRPDSRTATRTGVVSPARRAALSGPSARHGAAARIAYSGIVPPELSWLAVRDAGLGVGPQVRGGAQFGNGNGPEAEGGVVHPGLDPLHRGGVRVGPGEGGQGLLAGPGRQGPERAAQRLGAKRHAEDAGRAPGLAPQAHRVDQEGRRPQGGLQLELLSHHLRFGTGVRLLDRYPGNLHDHSLESMLDSVTI